MGKDEPLAMALNDAVNTSAEANWRDNIFKVKKVRYAIMAHEPEGIKLGAVGE